MAEDLNGLRVAVLLTDGVEESEFVKPKQALQKAGAEVTVVSPKGEEVQAFQHHEKSKEYKTDARLDKVDPQQFDAPAPPRRSTERGCAEG